jgi:hypothetical protein
MTTQRTISVWDRCTVPECNRVLHSISEGERGLCSSCWIKSLRPETRQALNRLVAAAFNGAGDAEKDAAVAGALNQLKAEDKK